MRIVYISFLIILFKQDVVYLSGYEDRIYFEYVVYIRVVLGYDVFDVLSYRSYLILNLVIVYRLSGYVLVYRFFYFFRYIYRLKMNFIGKIIMNFNV